MIVEKLDQQGYLFIRVLVFEYRQVFTFVPSDVTILSAASPKPPI